jgi:hypothetical protein
MTRHTFRGASMALLLGMSLSMSAANVFAAMVGYINIRTETGVYGRPDVHKLESRRPANLHLVANEQKAEQKRSKKQEPATEDPKKHKPLAEDAKTQDAARKGDPPEDSESTSPVGVAPESPQETFPHAVFSRIIDLPGAGVLTPKGTLVVEPYLSYAHLSSNRVTLTGFTIVPAITIGLINVQGVSRNIYTAALVGRYGLTNRLEVELRVPYLYRDDTYTLRPLAVAATRDTVEEFTGQVSEISKLPRGIRLTKGGLTIPIS